MHKRKREGSTAKNKEKDVFGYLEWYIDFLVTNGYHPTGLEKYAHFNQSRTTIRAWESILEGKGLVEIVKRPTGNVLIIKNVYVVDKRES